MTDSIQIKDKATETVGIKVAPFRKNIRRTSPHKHNSYLELIFLTEGTGEHTIDENSYPINEPALFIVRQEQLHFWNITSEPEGYVLLLKSHFADRFFDPELKFLTAQLIQHPFIPVAQEHVHSIGQLLALLVTETAGISQPNLVVTSLLKALVAKILLQVPSHSKTPGKNNLFSAFMSLLATQKTITNHVANYAGLLNTTPQNLNVICKKNSGRTASQIIAEHITAEASRLLRYTSLSISEIAYQLSFKDNSHFTKYFKRHTGKGPSELRATN